MTGKGSGRRGRPLGFRLSEASKRAISMSKTGQKHKPETREKISRSLILYFRKKNPLSEEITNRYCRFGDDELCGWICKVQERLDSSMNILTEKSLRNKGKIEITCGGNIEFFSHNLTPETIVMFKEYMDKSGKSLEDIF